MSTACTSEGLDPFYGSVPQWTCRLKLFLRPPAEKYFAEFVNIFFCPLAEKYQANYRGSFGRKVLSAIWWTNSSDICPKKHLASFRDFLWPKST